MKTITKLCAALIGLSAMSAAAAGDYAIAFEVPGSKGTILATEGQAAPLRMEREVSYLVACALPQEPGAKPVPAISSYHSGLRAAFTVSTEAEHMIVRYEVRMTRDLGLKTADTQGCRIELPQLSVREDVGSLTLPIAGGSMNLPLGDDVVRIVITPAGE